MRQDLREDQAGAATGVNNTMTRAEGATAGNEAAHDLKKTLVGVIVVEMAGGISEIRVP